MSVALRTITRLQDADDINVSLGAGVDEYALCWDNASGAFVLRAMSGGGVTDHGALTGLADDDHSQYLLATGARTGASSQAQTFTNGIVGPSWKPASDSTTALQVQQAGGTAVLTVDTSNSRLGIGVTPSYKLDVAGDVNVSANSVYRLGGNAMLRNPTGSDSLYVGPNTGNSSTGVYNLFAGVGAGQNNSSGQLNCYLGTFAGNNASTGGGNMAMGYGAGCNIGAGQYNVFLGPYSGYYNSGSNNIFIGTQTGWGNSGGSDNVFVGYKAGYYETGSGKLIFDNTDRANEADARIKALLYGEFNATMTSQLLRANGVLQSSMNDAATNAATTQMRISHNSSATVDNGFGSRVLWELKSSTTADQAAAALDVIWNEATHASRKADLVLTAYDTSEREGLRIRGAGSAPAIGFLGAAPVTRIAHVADPAGGATVDAEARSAINSILATLETFGFHATS